MLSDVYDFFLDFQKFFDRFDLVFARELALKFGMDERVARLETIWEREAEYRIGVGCLRGDGWKRPMTSFRAARFRLSQH